MDQLDPKTSGAGVGESRNTQSAYRLASEDTADIPGKILLPRSYRSNHWCVMWAVEVPGVSWNGRVALGG